MSSDDIRIAQALETIAERLNGLTLFLDDYAKHNFDDTPRTRLLVPASPGWAIDWKIGYGPSEPDRIIAWEFTDDRDAEPIPITTSGRENPGDVGRIVYFPDEP